MWLSAPQGVSKRTKADSPLLPINQVPTGEAVRNALLLNAKSNTRLVSQPFFSLFIMGTNFLSNRSYSKEN
jgi:hypothetical protein